MTSSSNTSRLTGPLRAATTTLALVVALSACTSSGAEEGVATLDADTSTSSEETTQNDPANAEEAMLAFAACMRAEGLDFPDPEPDEDGGLRFARPGEGGGGDSVGSQREAQASAREVCGVLLEGLDIGGRGGRGQGEFDNEGFLVFAACMRENGVTDFPDPGADGRPDREAMQDLDTTSETFQAAAATCQEESGLSRLPGGRGPGGRGA